MVGWQVTATTVMCEFVTDEVTIMVNNDWSVKCTGMVKYTKDRNASVELVKRSLEKKQTLECRGLDCPVIQNYILKLKREEGIKTVVSGETK